MATMVRTTSGNSFIYTVTDVAGNTATITQTKTPGYEVTMSYSGGPVLQDANQMISNLLLQLCTGLTPNPSPGGIGLQ